MYANKKLIGLGFGVTFALTACGGGGGGGSTSTPPPCAADTRTCYVRVTGSDANTGASPDNALRTISKAGQLARDGYTIIVGSGTYREGVALASVGTAPNGVRFIADLSGGPVVVDATGTPLKAGFSLSSTKGSLIDGFTITGGADAGIVIKSGGKGGSDDFEIRNCIVFTNPGDGIRIQDSANVLIFNNLVYGNAGTGISIAGTTAGSPDAHLINNTVAINRFRGINVGTTTVASPRAYLRNNIVQDTQETPSIRAYAPPPPEIPRSDVGYSGDFNLVRPATYLPANIAGRHDLPQDANFVDPAHGDYHLQANSPALNAGDSLNDMTELANFLRGRTTTGGTDCDKSALDLGYHYVPAGRCTAVP